MAKNIILNTVSADFISSVSDFSVARYQIRKLADVRNAEYAKADKKEAEIREAREKAMKDGMSADDAISRYPMTEADSIRNAAKEAYNKAVAPHNKNKVEAFKAVSDSVYWAYYLTIDKGTMDATGILRINKGQGTVEEHKVEKSFKSEIKDFLVSIGASMTENETALNKCAEAFKTWTAGAVNDNKSNNGQLLKAKGKNLFKEQFLRAFIQYGVSRNYLVVNADHTVAVREFEKADAKQSA